MTTATTTTSASRILLSGGGHINEEGVFVSPEDEVRRELQRKEAEFMRVTVLVGEPPKKGSLGDDDGDNNNNNNNNNGSRKTKRGKGDRMKKGKGKKSCEEIREYYNLYGRNISQLLRE